MLFVGSCCDRVVICACSWCDLGVPLVCWWRVIGVFVVCCCVLLCLRGVMCDGVCAVCHTSQFLLCFDLWCVCGVLWRFVAMPGVCFAYFDPNFGDLF